MCHNFLSDKNIFLFLLQIDQQIAESARDKGCSCDGVLHSANYQRKPRGPHYRSDEFNTRYSFCCNQDGCRQRCTPPSVRFLGRKVYLGIWIILVTAMEHGLTPQRRAKLEDILNAGPQTLARWQQWWRAHFPTSRCWQTNKGHFIPAITANQLPGELLGQLTGTTLCQRLCQLLFILTPITTCSSDMTCKPPDMYPPCCQKQAK